MLFASAGARLRSMAASRRSLPPVDSRAMVLISALPTEELWLNLMSTPYLG